MPTDPVCGIEMDEELSIPFEYKGKTYYFCCKGCKRVFLRKPRKWKKNV